MAFGWLRCAWGSHLDGKLGQRRQGLGRQLQLVLVLPLHAAAPGWVCLCREERKKAKIKISLLASFKLPIINVWLIVWLVCCVDTRIISYHGSFMMPNRIPTVS